jgi:diguanylate cyclase (GGDEF)-like protein/PAS domain S-box-containing protein
VLEAALHESMTRFQGAFDHATIGMALVATDGRWLDVNTSLCDLVGYTAEELRATTFQAITHPEDLDIDLALVEQVLQGEIQSYQLEKRYIHKQGHIISILLCVSLVRDTAGQPLYFVSQIQDITRYKQAEADSRQLERERETLIEQLNEILKRTDALYVLTAMVNSSQKLDEILQTVVETAASVLPADRTVLITVDLAMQSVTRQIEGGPGAIHVPQLSFEELWEGLSGVVLRDGRPVLSMQGAPDPRESERVQGRRIHDRAGSILVAPIRSQRAIYGTLTAINPPGEADFSVSDMELLSSLTNPAAIAIERATMLHELQQYATIDGLTQVLNRRAWLEHSQRMVALAQRSQRPVSVIMLDADHFKRVNDTYGHDAGDQVLRTISACCQRNVRAADLVGRYGGEEFVIFLPDTDRSAALHVAERLRSILASTPIAYAEQTLGVTVSQGVATMQGKSCDLTAMLTQADQALYAAKHAGRNTVRSVEVLAANSVAQGRVVV